jgi:hypothetical protein
MGVGMNVSQSRSHGLGGFTGSIIRGKMDLAMMGWVASNSRLMATQCIVIDSGNPFPMMRL